MKHFIFLILLFRAGGLWAAEAEPEKIFYNNGGIVRNAYVYIPVGSGPFPVMIFNQASANPSPDLGQSQPFPALAKFYNDRGWALFLPGRPVLWEALEKLPKEKSVEDEKKRFMFLMEAHNDNIKAALAALKAQAFADTERIFMSGQSAGAINTLLLAERKTGVRGYLVFSPGSRVWSENELLRGALLQATKNAIAPMFFAQPQNDADLKPAQEVGDELAKRGEPFRAKIFPRVGRNSIEAAEFAYSSPRVWGNDVFQFIDDVLAMKKPDKAKNKKGTE